MYGWAETMLKGIERVKGKKSFMYEIAHASVAIEGNSLSLEEVRKINLDVSPPKDRDTREMYNYLWTLRKIDEFAEEKLTVDLLLKIHECITEGTLQLPCYEGVFRKKLVFIVNPYTGERSFIPPFSSDVPGLVEELLEWYNREGMKLHPVIQAGIVHFRLVWIHPFYDGNGRTSRFLAALTLRKRDFDTGFFLPIDVVHWKERRKYIDALNEAVEKGLDAWLKYYIDCFYKALDMQKKGYDARG